MQIIKEGYVTRVLNTCPDLDINDIVSERSGDEHNILAVVGKHVLDKTAFGYEVLLITGDDAEPYDQYKNFEDAIVDLTILESVTITEEQKICILVDELEQQFENLQ
jgi:hypothetical protein